VAAKVGRADAFADGLEASFANRARRLLEHVRTARADRHARAFTRETLGDRATETAARACDDRDLSGEGTHLCGRSYHAWS
jgi:hypothetical protein